jgi:hypothetical protein
MSPSHVHTAGPVDSANSAIDILTIRDGGKEKTMSRHVRETLRDNGGSAAYLSSLGTDVRYRP